VTTGRVDKFGRKISETHEKDNLRRFYRLEHEEEEEAEVPTSTIPDYARGGVLMESSSESEAESQGAGDSDDESDGPGFVALGRDLDEEGEIDLDESTFADLDAQAAAYARAAPEDNNQEATEKTRRLAVVNLDWDHVRAAHLYKIFSSLVSPAAPATLPTSVPMPLKNTKSAKATVARGKVLSVRVYPSEFGKERIAREEKEGPPVEVFKKRVENEEDVNERTIHETGDGVDYDEDALRKYQLERLRYATSLNIFGAVFNKLLNQRYYYAIVECDTAEAAVHIYNELEGTELERSANVFDLSFVPDEMAFDAEYRWVWFNIILDIRLTGDMYSDEAIDDPGTRYRAVEFVTDVGEFHCYSLFLMHFALRLSVIQKSSSLGTMMIRSAITLLDDHSQKRKSRKPISRRISHHHLLSPIMIQILCRRRGARRTPRETSFAHYFLPETMTNFQRGGAGMMTQGNKTMWTWRSRSLLVSLRPKTPKTRRQWRHIKER
jgi:hypothetical protein